MPIQFGRWKPDIAGLDQPVLIRAINCIPNASGFRPLRAPSAVSAPLPTGRCYGAVTVIKLDALPAPYAGTRTNLYLQFADNTNWTDLTWAGGDYNTPEDEQWRFTQYGDLLIATNLSDPVQKASIEDGTQFEALGGSPPQARYIDTVRDFVVLACIEGQENSIQWSGLNNPEQWTPGLEFSDFQIFPQGGPITGILGGEVGYVFQRERVYRMTYVPGSEFVFQFDEVESGRGLAYPNSLVKLGNVAYYMSDDGLYKMDLSSGSATPIGVGKFHEYIQDDIKKGAEKFVYGAYSPSNDAIMWSYPEKGAADLTTPNRMLWYNPNIDEATTANIGIVAVAPWLTQGVSLDRIPAVYGSLDELPVSLDSAFWKGGAPLLGVFGTDNALSFFQGPTLETTFETSDGQQDGRRTLVRGVRPHANATDVIVAVSGRERDGDPINYAAPEVMEDTGVCPAWTSGNYLRARIQIAAGTDWTQFEGLDVDAVDAGAR